MDRPSRITDPYAIALSQLERFVKGRWWMARATVLLVLLSLFLHYPSRHHLNDHLSGITEETNWTNLIQQRDAPFTPVAHAPGSHWEKTAFRLTVPLVARALDLGPLGIYRLQVLLGILLIALVLGLAQQITRHRVHALLFTAGLVFTFAGSAAFFDTWGHRDPYAFFLLVLALAVRSPWVVGPAVLLAAFTDERALVASLGVLLFHTLRPDPPQGQPRQRVGPVLLAVAGAWLIYAALRAWLSARFGLRTPMDEVGLVTLLQQLDAVVWGLWSGLEAAWVLLVAFLAVLLLERRWGTLLAFALALLLVMAVAAGVRDVTRSMAYGFVLLFPALVWLVDRLPKERLTALLFMACLVSLLHPMTYTFGGSKLYPVDPIPIKVLRLFAPPS